MGRKERFRSRYKDNSISKESNVAYSEDKIRYFFMNENKPNQSEFLKTLIEKSHRKNKSALRNICLLYTSPSPRDLSTSRMPSSA